MENTRIRYKDKNIYNQRKITSSINSMLVGNSDLIHRGPSIDAVNPGIHSLTNAISGSSNPEANNMNTNMDITTNNTDIYDNFFQVSSIQNEASDTVKVTLPLQIPSKSRRQTIPGNDSSTITSNSHPPRFMHAPEDMAGVTTNGEPGPQARRRHSLSKLVNKKWFFSYKKHDNSNILDENIRGNNPSDYYYYNNNNNDSNNNNNSRGPHSVGFSMNNPSPTYSENGFDTTLSPREPINEFYETRPLSSIREKEKNKTAESISYHSIKLTPYIDHSSPTPEHYNTAIELKITEDDVIKLGRDSRANQREREAKGLEPDPLVVFYKSKVISRLHAQIFIKDGKWFIEDIHSASGTFVNRVRIPSSHGYDNYRQLKDGDILQLGANYHGPRKNTQKLGYYQAVRLKVELDRICQGQVKEFDQIIFGQLNMLNKNDNDDTHNELYSSDSNISTCVICLASISPSQSLFISRCSHVWHYKCIRPLIVRNYPIFECPCCRANINLEDDID